MRGSITLSILLAHLGNDLGIIRFAGALFCNINSKIATLHAEISCFGNCALTGRQKIRKKRANCDLFASHERHASIKNSPSAST